LPTGRDSGHGRDMGLRLTFSTFVGIAGFALGCMGLALPTVAPSLPHFVYLVVFWSGAALFVVAIFSAIVTHMPWADILNKHGIDDLRGWSVSIWTPKSHAGYFTAAEQLTFFQLRFVNVSKVRRRIIDIEVVISFHDNAPPPLHFRTKQYMKSIYEREVAKVIADKGDDIRGMKFLQYPIQLDPEEIVEGQLVFLFLGLPDEMEKYKDMNMRFDRTITFEFEEHISGLKRTLIYGDYLDATTGRVSTQIIYPSKPSRINKIIERVRRRFSSQRRAS
jgi:hypothetical protein